MAQGTGSLARGAAEEGFGFEGAGLVAGLDGDLGKNDGAGFESCFGLGVKCVARPLELLWEGAWADFLAA